MAERVGVVELMMRLEESVTKAKIEREFKGLRDENERLKIALQDIADELLQVEHYCPCGARPESLQTHPHVIGCHVAAALRIWHDVFHPDGPSA